MTTKPRRPIRRFLLPTLALALGAALIGFVLVAIRSGAGAGLYFAILGFANVLVPTLVLVSAYRLARPAAGASDSLRIVMRDACLVAAFVPLALLAWAVADVALHHASLLAVTWREVTTDFDSEFAGFLFVAIPIGFATPFVCRRFD